MQIITDLSLHMYFNYEHNSQFQLNQMTTFPVLPGYKKYTYGI